MHRFVIRQLSMSLCWRPHSLLPVRQHLLQNPTVTYKNVNTLWLSLHAAIYLKLLLSSDVHFCLPAMRKDRVQGSVPQPALYTNLHSFLKSVEW